VSKQIFSYHLEGSPTAFMPSIESRAWSEYKKICLIRDITLSNQHSGRPLLGGRLHVDYTFVFDKDLLKKPKYQIPEGTSITATIVTYVRFVESVAKSCIFNPGSVVSFTAKLTHDSKPKTEFNVIVLE
jgi:hypothetical protein